MYYTIQSSRKSEYGILEEPKFNDTNTSFLRGRLISEDMSNPMIFTSDYDNENNPKHFTGVSIPIWSKNLIKLFTDNGVDNLQCFNAKIINSKLNLEWSSYYAVNVLGIISCTNYSKSKYTEITQSPSGIPFAGFTKLVIDTSKVGDFTLFRLAENPGTLIAHEKLIELIRKNSIEGGWGVAVTPIEE